MTVKAYSYLRFSSQAQREGNSLTRQLKAATDWAAEHPDVELDTTARDLGVSAFKGEHRVKGALAAFLKRVNEGRIERGSYFLVESFDRLSRENETVAINLLTSITLAGIKVVTLVDGAVYDDKSDAMDLMRALIVMSRAHDENKARGLKLRAAWADKKKRARENGEILSRRGPAWTEFNETTRKFDAIPERAKIVQRIFTECTQGMGGTAIATRLNASGVKPFVAGSDGWHPGYVLTILKSRSVMGFYQPTFWSKTVGERAVRQHDGEDIPGYYPVVIEPELFERCQAIMARRSKHGKQGRGRRGKTFPNLLLGLGRCEVCGGTLVLGNAPNAAKVRFFRCYNSSRHHRCTNKERYLLEPIEGWLEYFLQQAKIADEPNSPKSEVTSLLDRQSDLKRRMEILLDQMEAGTPGVAERLHQRQIELVAVERAIVEAKSNDRLNAHANRSESVVEAIRWMRSFAELEGDDLYRARAKANALLSDIFDWIMPVANGGIYVGFGERFRWIGNGMMTLPMMLPNDTPINGAELNAYRGPLEFDEQTL